MSSKLYREGTVKAEPFAWQATGRSLIPPSTSGRPASSAGADAEEALKAAYQKGREAAEASAEQRAAARLAPALENFASVARNLAAAKKQLRKEAEESLVRLALAVARRVLHRELSTDPEAILGLIRSGLDRVSARERFDLRLAPADAAVVRQHRAQLNLPEAVEILSDNTLSGGSVVFETARGELDASVDIQLDEIERGFTDLLRRRA